MPRPKHGGARQGTPGKGYSNRTDLMASMRAPDPTGAAARGGADLSVRSAPAAQPAQPPAPAFVGPDQTPFATDPTAYPGEPLTARPTGMLTQPEDASVTFVRALATVHGNPDLRRLLARMENR